MDPLLGYLSVSHGVMQQCHVYIFILLVGHLRDVEYISPCSQCGRTKGLDFVLPSAIFTH